MQRASNVESGAGGVKLITGIDADGDGKLNASEAKSSAVLCNDPNKPLVVRVAVEAAGAK